MTDVDVAGSVAQISVQGVAGSIFAGVWMPYGSLGTGTVDQNVAGGTVEKPETGGTVEKLDEE